MDVSGENLVHKNFMHMVATLVFSSIMHAGKVR